MQIELVTRDGRVARTIDGPVGEIALSAVTDYVRARVRLVVQRGGEARAFFAWTQPVFVPAAGAAPAPPTEKPLSRLEKLRLEAQQAAKK